MKELFLSPVVALPLMNALWTLKVELAVVSAAAASAEAFEPLALLGEQVEVARVGSQYWAEGSHMACWELLALQVQSNHLQTCQSASQLLPVASFGESPEELEWFYLCCHPRKKKEAPWPWQDRLDWLPSAPLRKQRRHPLLQLGLAD